MGNIIVPEHVDKVKVRASAKRAAGNCLPVHCSWISGAPQTRAARQDFYSCDEGKHHPKPSKEFMAWRAPLRGPPSRFLLPLARSQLLRCVSWGCDTTGARPLRRRRRRAAMDKAYEEEQKSLIPGM